MNRDGQKTKQTSEAYMASEVCIISRSRCCLAYVFSGLRPAVPLARRSRKAHLTRHT